MNKAEAIQVIREELLKLECSTHDQIEYLKSATCDSLLKFVHSKDDVVSVPLLMVEISDIVRSLEKIDDFRKTLSVLESIE